MPGVDNLTRRVSRAMYQTLSLIEVGVSVYVYASLRPPSLHKMGSKTVRRYAASQPVLTRYKRL